MCMHVGTLGGQGSQVHMELELQGAVSHLRQLLEPDSGPLKCQCGLSTADLSLQPPNPIF